jgi:hypothetical protein
MLLIVLLLLLITVILSVNIKEGNQNQTPLNTPGVIINTDTNTLTVPNNVQGVQGPHLNFGDVSIGKSLSFVQDDNNVGMIAYKDDTLQMTGAGPDQKVSLWDKVDVGSLLTLGGDILMGSGKNMTYENQLNIVGGPSSVVHLGDNVDVSGNMTVFGNQDVSGNQKVSSQMVADQSIGSQMVQGVSTHKGKVNIGPTNATVDLSIGDELTGFKQGQGSQGTEGVSFTSNNTNMGGFDSKGLFVNNDALLEVGKGMVKDPEAGTIRYVTHPKYGDTVDLVGAGATAKDRKILLKDDVIVNQRLQVGDSAHVQKDLYVNGMIQLGSWSIFEDTAGQLRFSKNTKKLTRDQLKGGMKENDGIALTGDGKIWVTQKEGDSAPGWINDKIKNTSQATKVGGWELTQGKNDELLFKVPNKKSEVVMLPNGTVEQRTISGTFDNLTRKLTNVPYKEWGDPWKKHLDGNEIKYVSNKTDYWRVLNGGYEHLGNVK